MLLLFIFSTTGFEEAIAILEEMRDNDPYRLDDMDILSNMYYVNGQRTELAHLAHHCTQIDRFRVETCCVVGKLCWLLVYIFQLF